MRFFFKLRTSVRRGSAAALCVMAVWLGVVLFPERHAAAQVDVTDYFLSLKDRLIEDGFDENLVQSLYARPEVRFEKIGASQYLHHREAKLDYDQFAGRTSIQKAKSYMKTHKNALSAAAHTYGVDQKVITAIILVETRLGAFLGRRSVFNTLSSLSALDDGGVRDMFWETAENKSRNGRQDFELWAEKKSAWAYNELKAFLTYTMREEMDPIDLRGSYAGALGIPQFMPSSILGYARDGNNDGRIDLFEHADAIASVANYLKMNGWHSNLDEEDARQVIFHYNRSTYYVDAIIKISRLLER